MQSRRKRVVKSNHAHFEKFAAPTFNIHIHVPSCSSRISSVYIPRIQPVIHLHFDKALSGLEMNEKQLNGKVIRRTFKNLLDAASPRFGDVKFHFDNKLKESNVKDSEIINVVPNSSECQNDDTGLNKNEDLQKIQKGISENIESVTSSSIIHDRNSKNNENHKMPAGYWLDKDLKLRTAVVVLTDISKDKNYKDLIAAAKTNNSSLILSNKDDSSCGTVRTDQAQEMNKTVIKQENESYTSELSTEVKSENKFNFSYENCLDTCSNANTKELFNNNFDDKETVKRDSSLIALAEGCNFSEILTKFKVKYSSNKADSFRISDSSFESGTNFEINNTEEGNNKIEDRKTSDEMDYSDISNVNDIMCEDFNKNKFNVMENEHFNGNNSLKEVMGVSLVSSHGNIECINLDCSESDLPELNIKQEFNISTTDNTVADINSDECNTIETTSEKGLSSEQNVTDLDIVEPNSFPFFRLLLNKVEAPGMDKDMPVSPKKYTEKSVSIKEEYEAKSTDSSPSSSKKMKYSDEKAEKSGKKVMKPSSAEDYIILNETGPTKFAIAALDKIELHKRHPAENFKNEMLYGNRVQRFSSSHLKIYQAKNASRKSFNE